MTKDELEKIIRDDGALCNARHYGDVESIVNHINRYHAQQQPVTAEQVKAALARD